MAAQPGRVVLLSEDDPETLGLLERSLSYAHLFGFVCRFPP